MTEYRVPVIDPETGDDWDVEVEADSPGAAVAKAATAVDTDVHVSKTFARKHGLLSKDAEDESEADR